MRASTTRSAASEGAGNLIQAARIGVRGTISTRYEFRWPCIYQQTFVDTGAS